MCNNLTLMASSHALWSWNKILLFVYMQNCNILLHESHAHVCMHSPHTTWMHIYGHAHMNLNIFSYPPQSGVYLQLSTKASLYPSVSAATLGSIAEFNAIHISVNYLHIASWLIWYNIWKKKLLFFIFG